MKKLKKVLELAIVFAVVASVQAMKEKCVPIPKKTTEPAPNPKASPCDICPDEVEVIFNDLKRSSESSFPPTKFFAESLQLKYKDLKESLEGKNYRNACTACFDFKTVEENINWQMRRSSIYPVFCYEKDPCNEDVSLFLQQFKDFKIGLESVDDLIFKNEIYESCGCGGRINEYDFDAAESKTEDQIVKNSCAVCPSSVKDSFKRIQSQLATFQKQKDNAKSVSKLPSEDSVRELANDLYNQVINKFTENPSCETCLDHYTLKEDIGNLEDSIRIRHEMCYYFECPEVDSVVERVNENFPAYYTIRRTNYELAMQLNVSIPSRKQVDIQVKDGFCGCDFSFRLDYAYSYFDEEVEVLYEIFGGVKEVLNQCSICPVESVEIFTEISQKIPDWYWTFYYQTFKKVTRSEVILSDDLRENYDSNFYYYQYYYNALLIARDSLPNPSPCKTCSDQLRYDYQAQAEMVMEMMNQLRIANVVTSD